MIVIIDYGMGNLKSVVKAFKFLGFDALITSDYETIVNADKVVLPGVGAFMDGMKNIKEQKLDIAIYDFLKKKKPFLGICLGMHLLFSKSFEFGECEGLNILKGEVIKIDDQNKQLKVPHVGWNELDVKKDSPLLKNIDDYYVYFVHSYYVKTDDKYIVSTAKYGNELTAIVNYENIYATQFHPEKSGKTGLQILKNFGDLK